MNHFDIRYCIISLNTSSVHKRSSNLFAAHTSPLCPTSTPHLKQLATLSVNCSIGQHILKPILLTFSQLHFSKQKHPDWHLRHAFTILSCTTYTITLARQISSPVFPLLSPVRNTKSTSTTRVTGACLALSAFHRFIAAACIDSILRRISPLTESANFPVGKGRECYFLFSSLVYGAKMR